MNNKISVLKHNDGIVYFERNFPHNNKINIKILNNSLFSPTKSCKTAYPLKLVKQILEIKGPAYLCDEILRDESKYYVQNSLKYDLLSYLDEEDFKNKSLLDFGCGMGASTMILSRMFPNTKIVGIDFDEKALFIARQRAIHYGFNNLEFITSPGPNDLPKQIYNFNYIVLSGVFEHLLPNERKVLMPKIWGKLKSGGILFLNQTPNRDFPIETHTTLGLPFINYLPDKIAFPYAQYFSKTKLINYTWNDLLRGGIRGGTTNEILNLIKHSKYIPNLLNPSKFGLKNRIDLWYKQTDKNQYILLKKLFLFSIKLIKLISGKIYCPNLSLAIEKNRLEN